MNSTIVCLVELVLRAAVSVVTFFYYALCDLCVAVGFAQKKLEIVRDFKLEIQNMNDCFCGRKRRTPMRFILNARIRGIIPQLN